MHLRFAFGCLLFAAWGVPLNPGSASFHRWYGEPTLERFAARPRINVTVEYGPDRLACEVRISPARSLVEEERLQAAVRGQHPTELSSGEMLSRMSPVDVTDLIDQIAPPAMRGKSFGPVQMQASCGALEFENYENVRIGRGVDLCAAKEQSVSSASISFKRDTCPKTDSR